MSSKTRKGNGTIPRIDGKALGWAIAKAHLTLADIRKGDRYFSDITYTKMLAGMRPTIKSWTVICNLLRVPLNAFDLPAEGESARRSDLETLVAQHRLSAKAGSADISWLREPLRALGFPHADENAGRLSQQERDEDTARTELPGLLASLGLCLAQLLPRIARPAIPHQPQSGADGSASARQHGTAGDGRGANRTSAPRAARNRTGTFPSAPVGRPGAKKQPAKA